jgi:hypothetical protein
MKTGTKVLIGVGTAGLGLLLWWALRGRAAPPPPPPSKAILSIDTTPVKGQIFINGVLMGTAPITQELDTGDYLVSFGDVEGYITPASIAVTLIEGERHEEIGVYEPIPSPELATLRVAITDKQTNPINNVLVSLNGLQASTGELYNVCWFLDITPGTYTLTASKEGYYTYSKPITLQEGHNEASIVLLPIPPEQQVGVISGRVVDATTNKPLAWATVTFYPTRGYVSGFVYTDTAGYYTRQIEPKYGWAGTIVASQYGYQLSSATVDIPPWSLGKTVNFQLSRANVVIQGATFGNPSWVAADKWSIPVTVTVNNPGNPAYCSIGAYASSPEGRYGSGHASYLTLPSGISTISLSIIGNSPGVYDVTVYAYAGVNVLSNQLTIPGAFVVPTA